MSDVEGKQTPVSTRIPPARILAAFDFSPLSMKAWELASYLARSTSAAIEAVCVYEMPVYSAGLPPAPMAVVYPLDDELRGRFMSDLRCSLGSDVTATVRQGFPAKVIMNVAREHSDDLIVLGTHGRTGLGRVLLGSVAESLSRCSSIPVLTVHEAWKPIRSMLVPMNFTSYSLDGFFAAAKLAEALDARLDALFVATEPFSQMILDLAFGELVKQLPSCFARKPPRLLREEGAAAERIITVGLNYDLIVLVAHRKSLLRDVVLGTTAERVLRHSRTPVLAIPTGEGA